MNFQSGNNRDRGDNPTVLDIHSESMCNDNFRTVVWTGKNLQVTVMSIPVGGEIGAEIHNDTDQFLRIEGGCASVYMGKSRDCMRFYGKVNPNYAIIVPAGTWHNIVNACFCPLKLYSIYAPPHHPFGTVHRTKADSDSAED